MSPGPSTSSVHFAGRLSDCQWALPERSGGWRFFRRWNLSWCLNLATHVGPREFCMAHHGTGFVWKCCVPLNPMVLLIIIPFLNGYIIGNIPNIFRQTQLVITSGLVASSSWSWGYPRDWVHGFQAGGDFYWVTLERYRNSDLLLPRIQFADDFVLQLKKIAVSEYGFVWK